MKIQPKVSASFATSRISIHRFHRRQAKVGAIAEKHDEVATVLSIVLLLLLHRKKPGERNTEAGNRTVGV
jgi:hypothetical protein